MRNLIIGLLFGLMAPLTLWADNASSSAASTSGLGESDTNCHEIRDVARGQGEAPSDTSSDDERRSGTAQER